MFPRLLITLLTLASILAIPHPARSQKNDPQLKTVTYNIAEFLKSPRTDNQPNPKVGPVDPDAPIGNDTQISSATEARIGLINFFRENIDPDSWSPRHVPTAAISIDGDEMTVLQTLENQRQIADILKQLHSDGSEKVSSTFGSMRLGKLNFDKTPLFDALQTISKEARIPIDIHWESFRKIGIFADSPVTLELNKPTAPRAIRSICSAAIGYTIPVNIGATPKSITISFDNQNPANRFSGPFDVRPLLARVSGLDVKKPFTRAQALDALAERIKKNVAGLEAIRDDKNGLIIIDAPVMVHRRVMEYLDELDARSIAEVPTAK